MANQDSDGMKNIPTSEAIGQSEAFIDFQEQISQVAPIDRPVLILGERGTGKELAASKIHFLSKRWQKPLVTLNCSALTPTLIGSELFGYEKGAFTGAGIQQKGRFEKASEGTLFLDEIGTIPMEVQEKILRAVEYGSFERVGSSKSIHVDVRIVAATNVDLSLMAQLGEFKRDLLDRLSFEVIYVPPLRQRREDILILSNHFAGRMAFELGWEAIPKISQSALKSLEDYPWPGNIRELKNVVERAVYKSTSNVITDISFNPFDNPFNQNLEKGNSVRYQNKGRLEGKNAGVDFSSHNEPSQDRSLDILNSLLDKPLKEAVAGLEKYLISQAMTCVCGL